jgi:hypothetical protein
MSASLTARTQCHIFRAESYIGGNPFFVFLMPRPGRLKTLFRLVQEPHRCLSLTTTDLVAYAVPAGRPIS